ncbi:MAG TPA: tRNA (adenosine(37)-N6)-threonylcarbamoyltransferase complex dimerization subunit type 1 TsaB [Candidatus Sulfopaludibacter sp.]|nr:tRNA (adenosine(37)-N6)-threonylcarbamoyltransferase complex dimerization subunit type 1 TsaB [Candidatus Sulfopaludibacter sp.]
MKPLILALDTTREFGSIALSRGGELLEETAMHAPTGFAHVLYGHLGALLERNGVTVNDVDLFAASAGPGSFTGVRVGLACIKGLAEAVGKPAVAVSNLCAISTFGAAPLRAVLLDARRGEVYAAVYDAEANIVIPETVGPLAAWLETLPAGPMEFITGDLDLVLLPATAIQAPQSIAAAIARVAFQSPPADPAALDANYVRRSDAELFWKE